MTVNSHPRVSAVIVNWMSGQDLRECLPSVLTQTRPPSEVVIIDNASTDGSVAAGRETLEALRVRHPALPPVRWIMNHANVGFSGAANQGVAASDGEWVLLLNPDVVLTPRYLEEAWSALEKQPMTGSLAGKLLRMDRCTIDTTGQFLRPSRRVRERGYGETDRGQYDRPGEVFSVCGAVALYRRAMLESVAIDGEYFDEDFFAFYEDADLGWRAKRRGWRCWYQPTAVAYHARGGTNAIVDAAASAGRGSVWARWQMPRRPLKVQFHILTNRYLMLVKNERWGDALIHLPALAWAELVDWVYLFCVQPRLFAYAPDAVVLLKRAWKKRRRCLAPLSSAPAGAREG